MSERPPRKPTGSPNFYVREFWRGGVLSASCPLLAGVCFSAWCINETARFFMTWF